MAVLPEADQERRTVKKSIEFDLAVDEGLKTLARHQYRSQASLINQVLRDYVVAALPTMEAERLTERNRS